MILYLDTSAVVKLYTTELGSAESARLVAEARQVATNLVTYAETRAAFARKYRMRQMNDRELDSCKTEFELHWAGFFKMPVDARLEIGRASCRERVCLYV